MSAKSSSSNTAPVSLAPPEMYYKIESSDNQIFKVTERAIQQSKTLSALVSPLNYLIEDVERNDPIRIPGVDITGKILAMVLKWCEHHKKDAFPYEQDGVPFNYPISEYDKKLMDVDGDTLFDLIAAARVLKVEGLSFISCKQVALMAKGKTPQQIQVMYGIKSDEEDEAAAKAVKEAEEAAEKVAKEAEDAAEKVAKEAEDAAEKVAKEAAEKAPTPDESH